MVTNNNPDKQEKATPLGQSAETAKTGVPQKNQKAKQQVTKSLDRVLSIF